MVAWQGVFPSLLTPFDGEGRIDLAAFERHVDVLARAGVQGLIVGSTLGEAPALEESEKRDLLTTAVAAARPHGVPVIAALVETAPARRDRFLAGLAGSGADGLLLFPPLLYRPTEAEFADYVRRAVGQAGLPTMVFNKPAAFSCDFSPRLAAALADLELLQAVKEAAELTARIPDWRQRHGERLAIFAGDEFALEAMMLGAAGFIAGLGNVVPAASVALHRLCQSGPAPQARALYRILAPLYQFDVSAQLVQNIKLAAHLSHGFPEATRPPRQALQGDERSRVETLVRQTLAALDTFAQG